MVMGGRAYVVRDADSATGAGEVARVYPYTLAGLRQALDEARFRSYGGHPQLLAVVAGEQSRVIRRYEHGKEVPVESLPAAVVDHLAEGAPTARGPRCRRSGRPPPAGPARW